VVNGEAGDRTLTTLWPDGKAGTTAKTRGYQGADSWYRDEVYFPAGFQATRGTDWNWLYELHNYPDSAGDSNLALGVVMDSSDGGGAQNAGRLSTMVLGGGSPANPIDNYARTGWAKDPDARSGWIIGPAMQTGRWYDFVWHVHWDYRLGGSGLVEEWINGAKVGSYSGPTLWYYANNGTGSAGPGQTYLQHGYYRPTDSEAGYSQPTVTVYHAATMIGPSAASIGESLA
jgi:Polysaccharide lyase